MEEQRDYLYYDARSRERYNRRCIDGNMAGCSKCVGYCEYSGHSGFLTEKLRDEHDCLGKNCKQYLPKIKSGCVKKVSTDQAIKDIVSEALREYEGIKATKIAGNKADGFRVKYLTISDAYPIQEIEGRLSALLSGTVRMQKVNCDFEWAVRVIFG